MLLKEKLYSKTIDHHLRYPFVNENIIFIDQSLRKFIGYYRISRHYRWAINESFQLGSNIKNLIIVEDDLSFSEDFLEYFLTMSLIMDQDPSIYCVSAWNDNGKVKLINSEGKASVLRTDFFPGLGWLLKHRIWLEIRNEWPESFWDDWFRHRDQRRERSCLRPELSRTSTSGSNGVSRGQFFRQHLAHIHHFDGYNPFFDDRKFYEKNLQAQNYDRNFLHLVYNQSILIHPVAFKYLNLNQNSNRSILTFKMLYYTKREFLEWSKIFGLMDDFKFGIPRTAYKGIVSGFFRGKRFFLAPPETRTIYYESWN
ncbi:serotonin receptor [Sarcoptes scabiei]|nr:serotonin receptor [Sarcoptes scabiei]